MITETSGKTGLLTEIDEAASGLQRLMAALDEEAVNAVPYENSWTAGQLFRHVVKSTNGIAKAMRIESKRAERDAGERIPELKKTFLDFGSRLQSPDFIVPEAGPYNKVAITKELAKSFEQLRERTTQANVTQVVEGLPLGEVTKLELLHFVLYHMQRHLHQMKKIYDALMNKHLSE